MSDAKHIEARLERSLRNQVRAPRLDRRFDAAVWARIEAQESPATNPGAGTRPAQVARASRWLAISNSVGIAVTLMLVGWFALRSLAGIEAPLSVDVNLALPAIPEETLSRIIAALGQLLGLAALAFGLSFTSLGRRLRQSLS
jgi:hypothetical protein